MLTQGDVCCGVERPCGGAVECNSHRKAVVEIEPVYVTVLERKLF